MDLGNYRLDKYTSKEPVIYSTLRCSIIANSKNILHSLTKVKLINMTIIIPYKSANKMYTLKNTYMLIFR